MKFTNIFIASSFELKQDRARIEQIISRLTDNLISQKEHYLKTNIWEKESRAFNKSRKQEDFNKLVKESDVFFLLIGGKVGKLSYEEFQIAWDNFTRNNKPKKIVVFFKNLEININEIELTEIKKVQDLKNEILSKEQFFYEYTNLDELELYITKEIGEYIQNIPETIPSTYEVLFNYIELELIDKEGKRANFKKTQVLKILKPTQFLDDYIISEGKIDVKTIKFEKGKLAEVREDLSRYYLSVDMGRKLEKGEMLTKIYTCELIDTFPKNEEFWEIDAISKNHLHKINVTFPEERPCITYGSEIKRNFQSLACKSPYLEIIENRSVIDLEVATAQQYDKIRIKWTW